MKKFIIVIALLFPIMVSAQSATTNGGYVACRSLQWYEDMVSFTAAGDRASFQAYVDTDKCISVGKGLKITVVDLIGLLSTKVEFVFRGIHLWAATESITFDK